MCQFMRCGHALVVAVVLVEPDHSSEQCQPELLEVWVLALHAATPGGILTTAEKDASVTEHLAAGTGVNRATVLNSASCPVHSGVNGLGNDSIEFGGMTCSARIGGDVVEELVELSFIQQVEFAAILDGSILGSENEVGLATDNMRIIVSEGEWDSLGIFSIRDNKMGEIIADNGISLRRLPRALFVFLSEWAVFVSERRIGRCEA